MIVVFEIEIFVIVSIKSKGWNNNFNLVFKGLQDQVWNLQAFNISWILSLVYSKQGQENFLTGCPRQNSYIVKLEPWFFKQIKP